MKNEKEHIRTKDSYEELLEKLQDAEAMAQHVQMAHDREKQELRHLLQQEN